MSLRHLSGCSRGNTDVIRRASVANLRAMATGVRANVQMTQAMQFKIRPQQLARHSTISLTMDRYTHTVLGDLSEALASLPDFAGSDPTRETQQRATGTHGRALRAESKTSGHRQTSRTNPTERDESVALCVAFPGHLHRGRLNAIHHLTAAKKSDVAITSGMKNPPSIWERLTFRGTPGL